MKWEELPNCPEIFDDPNGGIILNIPIISGVDICIRMQDEQAQDMIDIIQNKLNARLP